jgi:hypothetical protein
MGVNAEGFPCRYPDAVYGQYSAAGSEAKGDIFYFDYGCVAMWGLTQKEVELPPGLLLGLYILCMSSWHLVLLLARYHVGLPCRAF